MDCTNSKKNCQRFGLIYLITNMINGKSYVGQTIQRLCVRLSHHKSDKKYLIGKAINKYGWENFAYMVLEENIPREMLDEREIFWIAKLKTKFPNGYNLTDGGEGGNGRIVTEEQRAKMSKIKKGNKNMLGKHHSEETKAKISKARKGQKLRPKSKEHRAKLSAVLKGRTISAEHRAKLSAAQKGKTFSKEHRANLSAANKGKTLSKETREKIGAAQKGKVVSEETRKKMSAAQKARHKKLKEEKTDD